MSLLQNLDDVSAQVVPSEQRQQASAQAYQQGMTLLAEAQNTGFADPLQLRQASESLLEAIRLHHSDPEPYIGMAYLLMLLEDPSRALNYLKEALRLDPGNASAASLEKLIRQSIPDPRQRLVHYRDRFEELLDLTMHQLSDLPPPEATPDPEALEQLEAQAIQFRRQYDELSDLAEQVSAQAEISTRRAHLEPIEKRLQLYEQALGASYAEIRMHAQMQAEFATAASLGQLAEHHADLAREELAITLDACDELADEINQLEAAGNDVGVLEADYVQLTEVVVELQESLDHQTEGVRP